MKEDRHTKHEKVGPILAIGTQHCRFMNGKCNGRKITIIRPLIIYCLDWLGLGLGLGLRV
jgi:hypothetical protein